MEHEDAMQCTRSPRSWAPGRSCTHHPQCGGMNVWPWLSIECPCNWGPAPLQAARRCCTSAAARQPFRRRSCRTAASGRQPR